MSMVFPLTLPRLIPPPPPPPRLCFHRPLDTAVAAALLSHDWAGGGCCSAVLNWAVPEEEAKVKKTAPGCLPCIGVGYCWISKENRTRYDIDKQKTSPMRFWCFCTSQLSFRISMKNAEMPGSGGPNTLDTIYRKSTYGNLRYDI